MTYPHGPDAPSSRLSREAVVEWIRRRASSEDRRAVIEFAAETELEVVARRVREERDEPRSRLNDGMLRVRRAEVASAKRAISAALALLRGMERWGIGR